jgi:hypothetical protein
MTSLVILNMRLPEDFPGQETSTIGRDRRLDQSYGRRHQESALWPAFGRNIKDGYAERVPPVFVNSVSCEMLLPVD